MPYETLAFDRGSVRTKDKFGRLHVAIARISKAGVNPYRGNEIPNWRELGLQPERIYQLFRAPEELAKAAPTFNNVPLLRGHAPTSAANPQKEKRVGSLGTDAAFEAPFLLNSLVIEEQPAIDAVESGRERELSCSYAYRADMTPGVTPDGISYDGIMRDIVGNHVALVPDGRAGDEVLVGDAALTPADNPNQENPQVAKKVLRPLDPRAAVAAGALMAYVQPLLANDAQIDYAALVHDVTAKNWLQKKSLIKQRLEAATKGKLAQDADLKDVHGLLDRLDGKGERGPEHAEEEPGKDRARDQTMVEARNNPVETNSDPEDTVPITQDDDLSDRVRAFLSDKLEPADLDALCEMLKPADASVAGETAEEKAKQEKIEEDTRLRARDAPARDARGAKDKARDAEPEVTRTAMDAALARTRRETETAVITRMNAIREAERTVRPVTGDPAVGMAFDSAADVYRWGLDVLGAEHEGIPDAALPRLFEAERRARDAQKAATPRLAMDAKSSKGFDERWPDARRVRVYA